VPSGPTLPSVAGFRIANKRTQRWSIAWYEPEAEDGSVLARTSEHGLLLFQGENVDRDTVAAFPSPPADAREDVISAWLSELVGLCRGAYTLVILDAASGVVALASDSLGLKPWFWCVREGVLWAASTKKGINSLLQTEPDIAGVFEQSLLGFCIGPRTVYRNVSRNMCGEQLLFSGSTSTLQRVAGSSQPTVDAHNINERAEELRGRFSDAVRSRLKNDRWGAGFLSGGLDSRMVVTSLVEQGAQPTLYSLTHGASLDVALASAFASSVGLALTVVPFKPGRRILWARRFRTALEYLKKDAPFNPTGYAWSGDGGSVCAGGVNVSDKMTSLLRAALNDGVEAGTLSAVGLNVPQVLLTSGEFKRVQSDLAGDLEAEIQRLSAADGVLNSYRFLVANDQRQHLDLHFEHWDQHRIQFFLPFYDRRVLELLLATPEEEIAKHRLYSRWLALLPSYATGTPWQTYPGHDPCPLPLPVATEYQFGANSSTRFSRESLLEFRKHYADWLTKGLPGWPGVSKVSAVGIGLLHALQLRHSTVSADLLNDLIDWNGFGGVQLEHE
jgi:asparagine synthase (glutamine-hydrolysing)